MSKKSKSKTYFEMSPAQVLLLIFGVTLVGVITTNALQGGDVLGAKAKSPSANSQTNVKSSGKLEKEVKIKDAVTASGKLHKNTMTDVVTTLQEVSDSEKNGVSEEVADLADETEEIASEDVEAIDAVESRPDWKVLLLGTDYKNLGQLRSNMVRLENQIRKINMTMESTKVQNQEQLQTQLETLTQEQERVQNIISDNESRFSILGWAFRFLSGYNSLPIGGIEDEVGSTEPSDDVGEVDTVPSTSLE